MHIEQIDVIECRLGIEMPQLHLYVPDEVARRLRQQARARKLTLSRYLAEIVEREIAGGWPDGYFEDVVGSWDGDFPEIDDPPPDDGVRF
jgi:hypothetical protein